MVHFRDIGEFSIQAEHNLLVVRCSAEWSPETTARYTAQIAAETAKMPTRWGVLAIVDGIPIWGPEGEALMQQSVAARYQRGMRAMALVLAGGIGGLISRMQMERIYVGNGIALNYCPDEASARAWLDQILAADPDVA